MAEKIIFQFTYPTGNMALNVGLFFGTSTVSNVKKTLKLMQQNCTEEQRQELLLYLVEEDRRRKALLDELGDLESKREQLLEDFIDKSAISTKRDLAAPEKSLMNQRKKIQAAVDMVKGEEWNGW